ncbi:MAG: hypothetical protein Q9162_003160 [Coniocarpon cinnabarinum]
MSQTNEKKQGVSITQTQTSPAESSAGPQPDRSPSDGQSRPAPGIKWGITPKEGDDTHRKSVAELPPDHPVHRWTPDEQAEMRNKGINPILKAEMDAAVSNEDGSKSKKKSFLRSMGTWGMNIK